MSSKRHASEKEVTWSKSYTHVCVYVCVYDFNPIFLDLFHIALFCGV